MDIPGHRLNHAPHIQASGFFLSLLNPVNREQTPSEQENNRKPDQALGVQPRPLLGALHHGAAGGERAGRGGSTSTITAWSRSIR
jgi:hypothetical protein